VGLSVPILGVLGLMSLSRGLRNLVGETLGQVQGVLVLRENAPAPILSHLRSDLAETLRKVPGVRLVAPQVWEAAPTIDGASLFRNLTKLPDLMTREGRLQSLLDANAILGQDIGAHLQSRSAIFAKSIKEGRYLIPEDRGESHVVLSSKTAAENKDASGRPKRAGDTIRLGNRPFTIVGVYDTGSLLLDDTLIMDIDSARDLLGLAPGQVSCFYVEADDPARIDEVARAIEAAVPGVDARSMNEFRADFGSMMGQLDTALLLVVGLGLVVGVVGIANTMLMSTIERFAEIGVLRTNGWSRRDVLMLIMAESASLGLLGGLVGCGMATLGATIANPFLSGGLRLEVSPWLLALGLGVALIMGTLGGLYPAWRASRMVPMDAIRQGSR
jgi:putative ABC transport system permease protein